MRNVTWTGLTWGEYKKFNLENCFYKTVVVLDPNKGNEVKRSINVQGPNYIQRKRLVKASNVNNEETADFNAGRAIRDGSLRLNINIPENFDNLNNKADFYGSPIQIQILRIFNILFKDLDFIYSIDQKFK